jgi:ABC-2 type transport system ATP-binding protein
MLPESSDSQETPRWQARGICRQYGRKPVLREVTFSLGKGQILGLLGPNGSGKTTLLEILALAARPDAGSILLDGADILPRPGPVRPLIGYVPQDIALFEELSVMDNLHCWCRLPKSQARVRIAEVTSALSLEAIARQKVSTLSGGMKRRVNLGVALLGYPSLLVLDEPFSGVDIDHREIMQLFLKQLASLGVSQIISGHSLEDLLPLADQIMVLRGGQTVFYDDVGVFRQWMADASGQASLAFRSMINGKALLRQDDPKP